MAAPKVTQATLKTPEQTQLMKLITDALTSGSGPLADIFGQFNDSTSVGIRSVEAAKQERN